MNQELFDKLLDQVDQEFESLGIMHLYNMSGRHGRPARYKRFMELVVKECIDVMKEQEQLPPGHFYSKSAMTHEYAIKEHFGLNCERE